MSMTVPFLFDLPPHLVDLDVAGWRCHAALHWRDPERCLALVSRDLDWGLARWTAGVLAVVTLPTERHARNRFDAMLPPGKPRVSRGN